MPSDCQTIRADRRISSTKRNFQQLPSDHRHQTMVVSSRIVEGSGSYEVIVQYEEINHSRRISTTRNGNSFRADILPGNSFTPIVEVLNMSDEHIRVQVCLSYYG